MAITEYLPREYLYAVLLVFVFYCFLNLWMAPQVGRARKRYNVLYPSHPRVFSSATEEPLYSEGECSRALNSLFPYVYIHLLSKLGLHYYNMQKGTNLQFLTVHHCKTWITSIYSHYMILEARNQVDHSSCEFEITVRHALENIGCVSAIITRCRLKPQTPNLEEVDEVCRCWNPEVVDDFFKGDMPDWMTEDALTGSNKLQYYEVEEENEWLDFYAELALYSKLQSDLKAMAAAIPFEMRKIVVRTRENVESKKKVIAENAIFYISFKTRCGKECNGIIRRTTDKVPGHFSLEAKCFM